MSSVFGNKLKISVFGQSHSPEIGVVIDGFPAGFAIDFDMLKQFMAARAPGNNSCATSRKEADEVRFISGLVNGITCGAPICAVISNKDAHSEDYPEKLDIPRPSHADYTNHVKYNGFEDLRGGGHSSGRMTAPLCIAGALCLQLLEKAGIKFMAHISSIRDVNDDNAAFSALTMSKDLPDSVFSSGNLSLNGVFPTVDTSVSDRMKAIILDAKEQGDSVGGTVEVAFTGLPEGLGAPMFDGLESRISSAVFAVPAVKGIEFGNGFEAAKLYGSENNDAFCFDALGNVVTKTNNHGGILGGISSGMPLIFRVAVKPTPSIAKPEESISLERKCSTVLEIKGRHDPCIVPRAIPGIVASAAVALADEMLYEGFIVCQN